MEIILSNAANARIVGKQLHVDDHRVMTQTGKCITVEGGGGTSTMVFHDGGKKSKYTIGSNIGSVGDMSSGKYTVGRNITLHDGNDTIHVSQGIGVMRAGHCVFDFSGNTMKVHASKSSAEPKPLDLDLNEPVAVIRVDEASSITLDETAALANYAELHADGASTITIHGHEFDALHVNLDGASTCHVKGMTCESLNAYVSGDSTFRGPCTAQSATVVVTGASSCRDVHVTGSGSLRASGVSSLSATCVTPALVTTKCDSLSTLRVGQVKAETTPPPVNAGQGKTPPQKNIKKAKK